MDAMGVEPMHYKMPEVTGGMSPEPTEAMEPEVTGATEREFTKAPEQGAMEISPFFLGNLLP